MKNKHHNTDDTLHSTGPFLLPLLLLAATSISTTNTIFYPILSYSIMSCPVLSNTQDTHDATLLQYGQFERIVSRVTTSSVTVDSMLDTLPRPTIAPTGEPSLLPTLAPTLNISSVDSSNRDFGYYAQRTAPLYCIGIGKLRHH
jgi:hypothetical protein